MGRKRPQTDAGSCIAMEQSIGNWRDWHLRLRQAIFGQGQDRRRSATGPSQKRIAGL
jgi:hypothetical protein